MEYVGAFRVPAGKIGSSEFDYGGSAIAYNAARKSLFIVGHVHQQAVAEIAIPDSLINSPDISRLATATVLQPFSSVLPRIPHVPSGQDTLGGLIVDNQQLIGTAYVYYDGAGTAIDSHYRFDSLTPATAKVGGMFRVGNVGAGLVAGYMAAVPPEWQGLLGAPYLTGQAAINIISRTSSGPAVFGFNPNALGSQTAPAIPYVYYPIDHQLGSMAGPSNGLFNGTTQISGVFFVPGTRSVVFLGSNGSGNIGYGEAAAYNDAHRVYKSYHAPNGNYAYQAWAYDASEFQKVKDRLKRPWVSRPYAVWNFDLPHFEGSKMLGGVATDLAGSRIYVSQMRANRLDGGSMPLIHVFHIRPPWRQSGSVAP